MRRHGDSFSVMMLSVAGRRRTYVDAEHKRCSRCANTKHLSEFQKLSAASDGLDSMCRLCRADYQRAYRQRFYADREKHHRYMRSGQLARYNMTLADYERLAEQQGGVCAVCKQPPLLGKYLHVDHDHNTGKVRGLLCLTCNSGLGKLRDDPELLRNALIYLEGAL